MSSRYHTDSSHCIEAGLTDRDLERKSKRSLTLRKALKESVKGGRNAESVIVQHFTRFSISGFTCQANSVARVGDSSNNGSQAAGDFASKRRIAKRETQKKRASPSLNWLHLPPKPVTMYRYL